MRKCIQEQEHTERPTIGVSLTLMILISLMLIYFGTKTWILKLQIIVNINITLYA